MKRKLTAREGVEAAAIVCSLNTEREQVMRILADAGLPCDPARPEEQQTRALYLEWYAFVHAAVLYALMEHAPNVVVLEYVRTTKAALAALEVTGEEADRFVDASFSAYVEPLLRHETGKMPDVFFRKAVDKEPGELPPRTVAVVSGTMAMVMAAIFDKFEQFEFLAD